MFSLSEMAKNNGEKMQNNMERYYLLANDKSQGSLINHCAIFADVFL